MTGDQLTRDFDRLKMLVMAKLFEVVRMLVAEGAYVIGEHASERLQERG